MLVKNDEEEFGKHVLLVEVEDIIRNTTKTGIERSCCYVAFNWDGL